MCGHSLSVFLLLVGSATSTGPASVLPNGVASGDVTQSSAVLWTRSEAVGGEVLFEYSTDPLFGTVDGSVTAGVVDAAVPLKTQISGLAPDTQYYYRATDTLGASAVGRFRTPVPAGTRAGLRFGVSGDEWAAYEPFRTVDNVPGRDLDFYVSLGDTVYADEVTAAGGAASTLSEFRAKNAEVYADGRLAALRASTPILATYDDHEVIDNFAGGAPPASDPRFDNTGSFINETNLFNNGVQAFVEYNPLREEVYGATGDPLTAGKRDFYRMQDYGSDARIMMLDTRSFRSEAIADPDLFTGIPGWLDATYDPGRTMLGQPQLATFEQDLLDAQLNGTTWKFVMVPEPIEYLGPIGASDRFESYAAERAEILRFIDENDIENVVFVTTDIHQQVVNELSYRDEPNGPDISIDAFEISTGPIGYEPGGVTVLTGAHDQGLIPDDQWNAYLAMSLTDKDLFFAQFLETTRQVLPLLGYYPVSPFGLESPGIDAELLQGRWVLGHTLNWTEFEIDPLSQRLLVTTYGVDPLDGDPQLPQILSQFAVTPVPEPTGGALFGIGVVGLALISRRRGRSL